MSSITVYTKSHCQQCVATKKRLNSMGVEFDEVNLEENPEIVDSFVEEGFVSAPIVVLADGEKWSGYRPDLLADLV